MCRSPCVIATNIYQFMVKFLYLLKLPSIWSDLEWSASFFHLSLPSTYGSQVSIYLENLLGWEPAFTKISYLFTLYKHVFLNPLTYLEN